MTKILIKRVKRSEGYERNRLDAKFVKASVLSFPEIGTSFLLIFDRLGWGNWHTSKVTEVYLQKSVLVVKTRNSTYHIKIGWKTS